jgi:hypothetical protein
VPPVSHIHFIILQGSLMFKHRLPRHVVTVVFGLLSIAAACGDDSDATVEDAGPGDGGSGSGGKSGNGGKGGSAATSGSGGSGGSNAGAGGTGGGSSGSSGGTAPAQECTEDPPASPFKCGDETCTVPEYPNNPCVVPCCIEVDGQAKCGAKSTSEQFAAVCALPVEPDSQCAAVPGAMGGDEMAGCCNYDEGKCGIISSARPGCITTSTFVEIPDVSCSKPDLDSDAGVDEPDAG